MKTAARPIEDYEGMNVNVRWNNYKLVIEIWDLYR